jgi:hypothetical protein
MRQFHSFSGHRRRIAIDASVILLLTLTGPFGTFVDLPTPLRFAYWTSAIGGCGILMHVVIDFVLRMDSLAGWPKLPRIALGSMIAAIPGAALIGLLEAMFRESYLAIDHYLWFWFCVAGIGLLLGIVQFGVLGSFLSGHVETANVARPDSPFLDRLPRELGRQLVSLSMQDHYARVTTSRGSAMILIRFADAVRELENYPGAQVHRSHWVARGHAKRLVVERNRRMVELSDGRRLPVSRPYLEDARSLIGVDNGQSPAASAQPAKG